MIDVKKKLKAWGLLKTRKDYEFYKSLSGLTLNEKTKSFGPSLLAEIIKLVKLQDESKIKRYVFRITGREKRILLADTYFYMRKGFQKLTSECIHRIIKSCTITGKDCDGLKCPLNPFQQEL
ncbi:hypothetical protein LCGC14_2022110 [marine sediment metagenome]|uniref:Uncharacterized protein n=1 Tax=marine sediment metagenome TaxID=412755 RepID=A0A0F9FJP2_9ZZZZ